VKVPVFGVELEIVWYTTVCPFCCRVIETVELEDNESLHVIVYAEPLVMVAPCTGLVTVIERLARQGHLPSIELEGVTQLEHARQV